MAEQKEEKKHLFCPYCDDEIMTAGFPYCQVCGLTVFYCPKCHKPLPREDKVCSHCGAEIRG
ncbi:zinc-ribbon domain-containing protein [Chloroflexota bacterium]